MLALEDVSIRRGGREVLRDVSLIAPRGEVTALVGPNGAGKTTALGLLTGDLKPDTGEALMDGRPVRAFPLIARALRRAVMPQGFEIAFDFTVREVVEMGLMPGAVRRERLLTDALSEAGVQDFADRQVTALSGGERQRVALARALAQIASSSEAGYLLLDEPTASLDLAHQVAVMRTARRAAAQGLGVVVVLHDLNLAAAGADRAVLLSGGRVEAAGPPGEILTEMRVSAVYGTAVRRFDTGGVPILSVADAVFDRAG